MLLLDEAQHPPALNGMTVHRVRRGQTLEDAFPTPSSPSLQALDGPFQLQEYLDQLIRLDPHNVEHIVALPQPAESTLGAAFSDEPKGKGRSTPDAWAGGADEPSAVDTDVWVYEQLRRIVLDFSAPWLVALQRACHRDLGPACSGMAADDWEYLCASHGEERQCCAIDYITHTLDGTTSLLNSTRHFPSRTYIPTTSLRHFGSISRRLGRCFVHAWDHHRDVFGQCEAETSLYARFRALAQAHDLVDVDSLPTWRSSPSGADDFEPRQASARPSGRTLELAPEGGAENEDDFDDEEGEVHSEDKEQQQAQQESTFGRSDTNATRRLRPEQPAPSATDAAASEPTEAQQADASATAVPTEEGEAATDESLAPPSVPRANTRELPDEQVREEQ